jgi:hypothetical protein
MGYQVLHMAVEPLYQGLHIQDRKTLFSIEIWPD